MSFRGTIIFIILYSNMYYEDKFNVSIEMYKTGDYAINKLPLKSI